jgi:hypothetical protein
VDRSKQSSRGFLVVALLLHGELGVGFHFSKQLADAGHVHASKAQRSALARQKTRAGRGKHFASFGVLGRDAHVLHARRWCDLHGLHSSRKWNMRRSACSAANDRISDDVFDGNSARGCHVYVVQRNKAGG